MRKIIAAALLVLTIAGCMVGPDYRRPTVETPQSWRFEEKEARDIANTAWWEQFNDQAMNELIAIALRESKDLKIASARVEEYRGRYAQARAPLFPQIGAGAEAQGTRLSERGQSPIPAQVENPAVIYSPSLSASWEIDLWGKLRRATEAARADLLSTEEGRRSIILSLVTAVASSYVTLLDLDRELEIARNTASAREHSYNILLLRFQEGYISELDLSQAKSAYEQVLTTIPPIQKAIAQHEDALSVLIGRNPGPIPRDKALDQLGLPAVPAALPSELLERRPDIRQAEQNLISANAMIGVARAQYFPSISLTGMFGWESTRLSSLFTGPARTWAWAVPVTQPIFTGGAIAGQVKTAEAIREEALLQYQQVIQNAFRDVEDALIDQRRTREQLEAQTRQVEALRTYVGAAREQYGGGYSSYIDVLDAERSLYVAELSYTQTRGTLFRALVDLYKAMGGGWVATLDGQSDRAANNSKAPEK